jgi:hypothetical protein
MIRDKFVFCVNYVHIFMIYEKCFNHNNNNDLINIYLTSQRTETNMV